ncbi:MAG: Dabb family protein [Chloroflexota bacterium]|nr:Dabb family protein [Dehalococcoidia bacterium]MDW8254977.1 Dabb family protein [Chloroflexota bacterium]
MYSRIILVKFKEGITDEEKAALKQACYALKGIESVRSVHAGENVGPRPLGFDFGCILTFDDREGKNQYEPHDLHKALVSVLRPASAGQPDSIMLFDIEN